MMSIDTENIILTQATNADIILIVKWWIMLNNALI